MFTNSDLNQLIELEEKLVRANKVALSRAGSVLTYGALIDFALTADLKAPSSDYSVVFPLEKASENTIILNTSGSRPGYSFFNFLSPDQMHVCHEKKLMIIGFKGELATKRKSLKYSVKKLVDAASELKAALDTMGTWEKAAKSPVVYQSTSAHEFNEGSLRYASFAYYDSITQCFIMEGAVS